MDITKKSLGHFPFGSREIDESEYSFIPDMNGGEKRKPLRSVKSDFTGEFNLNKELQNLGDNRRNEEEISQHLVERDVPDPVEEDPPKKKVASYYLEVDLIDRLKMYAEKINRSYSAVVTDAIEEYIEGY
ncbi:hypothetical protein [Rhodohalobacter sp.]|uniref:hypothetical protein n=1 Tax=Rhodohalobacter sp. TaxID=1974210 RepID=UPI002ACED146|nr:hypothetical protein [Rhodohalobacter sp.]MDZ7757546.1 hypothetical protein [Rhodohalobacter sp.]